MADVNPSPTQQGGEGGTSDKAPTAPGAPAQARPNGKPQTPMDAAKSNVVKAGGDAAPDPKTPPQSETPAEAKRRLKFKHKIDGKDLEEELDEDEIGIRLQKAHAAEKRMQEAAEMRKKFQTAIEHGKKDPASAFKTLFGMDLDEYSQKRIAEKYNESLLPEPERKAKALEQELAQYKAREQQAKEAETRKMQEAREREVWDQTEKEYLEALDSLGYDKQFSGTVALRMMADVAEANLEHGVDLSPKQLAKVVGKQLETIHKQQMKGLKGESLLAYIGEDTAKEIVRALLAKTQAGAPVVPTPPPGNPSPQVSSRFKDNPFVKANPEARRRLESLYGDE